MWSTAGEQPGNPDCMLACVCMRGRLPPPTPEKVERLLRTEKTFTNSSDVAKVAALYAAFFDEVVRATELNFRAVGWTGAEAAELCEALPRFRAIEPSHALWICRSTCSRL